MGSFCRCNGRYCWVIFVVVMGGILGLFFVVVMGGTMWSFVVVMGGTMGSFLYL